MEDRPIIVPVPAMGYKVLHGLRRRLGEQPDMYVAHSGMYDRRLTAFLHGVSGALLGCAGLARGLLVEDVALGLAGCVVVREDVEPGLAVGCAEEHGVAGLGFGEEGVGGGGHFDGYERLFARCALVECEVEGTDGFLFCEAADDFVSDCVYDFDAGEGAVDYEVAGFVEDDVGL